SEDAQVSSAESQLQTVRNQIELFRVRNNGIAPALDDLFDGDAADPLTEPAGGWTSIVNADYLRVPPVNPRTGEFTVAAGTEAPTDPVEAGDDGWIYDEDTGRIWMNGFDEVEGEWFTP
ncbi:MAG: hypothetical protein AAFV77_06750, partial [Planctomycetota bacterium]